MWEVVGGCGRLLEVVGGCGRLWDVVGGCGGLWGVMGGCGRLWRVVGGCGRSLEVVLSSVLTLLSGCPDGEAARQKGLKTGLYPVPLPAQQALQHTGRGGGGGGHTS